MELTGDTDESFKATSKYEDIANTYIEKMKQIESEDGWELMKELEELVVHQKKADDGIMMLKKWMVIEKSVEDVFKYYSCKDNL